MNEKYTPVIVRFAAIVIVLIVAGVALTRYLSNRGDTYLAEEEARAKALGWLQYGSPRTPPPSEVEALKAIEDAFAALSEELAIGDQYLVADPAKWWEPRGIAVAGKSTDSMAQILSDHLPALEETSKQTLTTKGDNFSHRRGLTYALVARALHYSSARQKEQAYGTLRLATIVSGIFSATPPHVQGELDTVVRSGWVKLANAFPTDPPQVPISQGALSYASHGLRQLIRTNCDWQDWEGDLPNTNQKRIRFEQLKRGSDLTEELATKERDLYTLWQYLKGLNANYTFNRTQGASNPENHAAFMRDQVVREQLTTLFSECLMAGTQTPPPGLSKSRDPFNSSKPLKFKKYADGFAIYSVGANAADNGGKSGDMSILVTKDGVKSSLDVQGLWR